MRKDIIDFFKWMTKGMAYFTVIFVLVLLIVKQTELAKTYTMISNPFWLSMIYFELKKNR